MSIEKLLEKSKRLREAATPVPYRIRDIDGHVCHETQPEDVWLVQTIHNHGSKSFTNVIAEPQHGNAALDEEQDCTHNMRFIVAACNTQETYERIVEVLVEALKHYDEWLFEDAEGDPAREAIAEVNALAQEALK